MPIGDSQSDLYWSVAADRWIVKKLT